VDTSSKRSARILLFTAAPIAFVAIVAWATMSRSTRATAGDPAPDFSLPSMNGGEVGLSEFEGRPLFINFWASWCIPCREEAPDLVQTWRSYEKTELAMIGINWQDLKADAAGFVDRYAISYPTLRDTTGRVATAYGVLAPPESVFISREGLIESHIYGPMTGGEMKAQIDDLLATDDGE
jgi:cytochrome c biogenesis protein CcmG, thiol:disulfide interchange protein DsbE